MSDQHNTDFDRFQQFLQRREAASLDYVRGQADPFMALVAQQHDASFFPPGGGAVHGTKAVAQRYERDAAVFDAGTESSRFEVFHAAADAGVAYWTGLQHARVRMKGKAEAISMSLRVTEVFRAEANEWKLVHRHADMLTEPQPRA